MVVEKINGSGLVVVKDTFTGLKLDSMAEYSVSCTVNVIDEEVFNHVTASQSLKDLLNNYIGTCFGMCLREAYPDGIEYEELTTGAVNISENIKNQVSDILEVNGIALETASVDSIIIDENSRNMLEKMHKMKAGINNMVPNNIVTDVEWTCTCGKKNAGNFCTECGSSRERR
ncbi:MAG: hypothetical protein MJ107_02515 [Lachnospiraceae bacterium]|nr:hypothetical protein [Lachnospiraceae bacterium]